MITAQLVASTFASLVWLLRHAPTARDQQTATVEHLLRLTGEAPLHIAVGFESLSINDTEVPIEAPGAALLNEHLLMQGITRVAFTAPLAAERVLGLGQALAAFPGTFESFAEFQEAAGAGPELVLAEAPSELSFERYTPIGPLLSDPDSRPPIEREDFIVLAEEGGLVQYPGLEDLAEMESADQERLERLADIPSATPMPDQYSNRLTKVLERGRLAGATEDWEGLLQAALEILEIEAEAPTEAFGAAIRIELRRLLPRTMLYEIARLASAGGRKQDALAILRKLGADSTEVLMDLLVEAMSLGERRGYYSALTHMSEGHDVIIAHLRHRTWYVVRNAAELCGEMDLERAVPDLALASGHEDERVRRSVAGALAKIASPQALEPLRRLLSDPVPAVRLRVAASLNLRRARSLVMPLAAQLAKETQPEVIKELTTVLGRIGTPDAVQALSGFAQPSTRMLGLGGRPAEHRVWAVEGLGHAGTAATQALKALSDDSDETVARAAQEALAARAG